MAQYRVDLLTPRGDFLSARQFDCENDAEALKRCLDIGHPHRVEIWRSAHLVARIGPQPEGPRR